MKSSTETLQRFHEPVTDLFPRAPKTPAERRPYELTAGQIDFFRANGFVKSGRILDEAQMKVLREELEEIRLNRNPLMSSLYEVDADYLSAPDKNVFHFLGAWLISKAFHDILWHPAITVKMAQLLDSPSVRLWHDQVFYKPPRHPGVVTWHQDYSYWTRAVPARHLTIWIGLDDSTLENGCLHYVPKSHEWGLVPKISLTKNMDDVKQYLTPDQLAQFRPEPMILKAGESTIHHSHMMHGSYGNRSDRHRRAIVLNYMHPETRSDDEERPLLAGVPLIPKGAVIEGEFFPIVLR